MSGETAAWPSSTRDSVWRATPSIVVASGTLWPRGCRQFSLMLRPGCGGFFTKASPCRRQRILRTFYTAFLRTTTPSIVSAPTGSLPLGEPDESLNPTLDLPEKGFCFRRTDVLQCPHAARHTIRATPGLAHGPPSHIRPNLAASVLRRCRSGLEPCRSALPASYERVEMRQNEIRFRGARCGLPGRHAETRSRGRGLVGETGFEPAAPCTPCRCATKLRHSPTQT